MMDDLYEKFLPQFVELSRVRIERALETLAQPERTAEHTTMTIVIRELHSITGEAGLLGLPHVMALARQTEELAKRLRDSGAAADADALTGAIRDLKDALELVGASRKS